MNTGMKNKKFTDGIVMCLMDEKPCKGKIEKNIKGERNGDGDVIFLLDFIVDLTAMYITTIVTQSNRKQNSFVLCLSFFKKYFE